MATDQPRELLGLPVQQLEVEMPAELVLFDLIDGQLKVQQTIVPA
jgi:hypothetical protein